MITCQYIRKKNLLYSYTAQPARRLLLGDKEKKEKETERKTARVKKYERDTLLL